MSAIECFTSSTAAKIDMDLIATENHNQQNQEELKARIKQLEDRIQHLHNGIEKQNQTIEQACGKALGYPWFKDDQKTFPGATENDGVCVAGHFAETIVWELVGKYTYALDRIKRLEDAGDRLKDRYILENENWDLQTVNDWNDAKEAKL